MIPNPEIDQSVALPFSVKNDFQKFQPESFEKLQEVVNSKWLRVSMGAALAKVAAGGADTSQISGARMFIDALIDLSHRDIKVQKLPRQTLETYEQQ